MYIEDVNIEQKIAVGGNEMFRRTVPIGANLYQPFRFTGMKGVTLLTVTVKRDGEVQTSVNLAPYENMVLDLSVLSMSLQSVTDLVKGGNGGSTAKDIVEFTATEGGYHRKATVRVTTVASARMGFTGAYSKNEATLGSNGAFNPEITKNPTRSYSIDSDGFVDGWTGCTRVQTSGGDNSWACDVTVPYTKYFLFDRDISISLNVRNMGYSPITFIGFERTALSTTIPAGATVRCTAELRWKPSDGFSNTILARFIVSASPADTHFACWGMMVNYGSKAQPFAIAEADLNSRVPFMGFLSDYGDGHFNTIYNAPNRSGLMGAPVKNRIFIPTSDAFPDMLVVRLTTGENWKANSGERFDADETLEIQDGAGNYKYGLFKHKEKFEWRDSCNVCVKWLNSRGCYDSMYFSKYKIQPIMDGSVGAGYRVGSYTVDVSTEVDADKEPALYWLVRSIDIQGIFEIDPSQWARVTYISSNYVQMQGGSNSRVMNLKFKFEVILS